jgi:hypothetical protein
MKLKHYFVLFIPIVILVVFRIPSLFESYWYGDEAIYAAVAQEIKQGKALYAETWDHKPPLIFWIFYPAALVGWGKGLIFLRAFNMLLGVLTLVFVNSILVKRVGIWARFAALLFLAFFLGSTLLEGNILNAEVIFIAFNMLAFLLLLKRKWFVVVGFLAFLSLITKVPGFVEFALVFVCFAVIYLKEKGLRYLITACVKIAVGFAVPLVLVVLYFAWAGTLADFIYANATFNRIYSLHQSNYFEVFGRQYPNTLLQLISYASIFVFTTILYLKKKMSAFLYLSVNLFTVQAFASLLSAKNYSHYFLQVLPGAAFLLAIALNNIKSILKVQKLVIWSVILVLFIPILIVFKSGGEISIYAKPNEYYPWFYKGYILGDETFKNKFWWSEGEGVKKTKRYAEYLRNNYTEYDPVYIYTDKPWVQALAGRNLVNKYVVWFHLAYRQEHLDEEIENMRRAELFVVDNKARLLQPISDVLSEKFEKIDEFEELDIYIRIN